MVAQHYAAAPLLALAAVGCQSYAKLAALPAAAAVTTPHRQPQQHAEPLSAAAPPPASRPAEQRPLGPFAQLDEQQALQGVLPQLKELASADPQLHSAVLEQFATTDPSLWGRTVEHALSKARYQQSLAGAANTPPQEIQLTAATMPAPPAHSTGAANPLPVPPSPGANQNAASVFDPPPEPAQTRPKPSLESRRANTQPAAPQPRVIENHHAISPRPGSEAESKDESTIRLVTTTEPAKATDLRRLPDSERGDAPSVDPIHRDWRSNLDAAIAALESDVADSPRSTAEAYRHVRLNLLRLAAGSSDDAVAPPPGLSTTEQSFWSKQLFALSTLLDAVAQRDLGGRAAAAGRHQAEASASLRQLGDLRVNNLTFCDEVYGFGAYEPIDRPRFTAGQSVTLYTEVENYRSDSTAEGYRTSLATSYRVLDRHGALVDSGEFPVVEDLCLSRRRDFHIQYSVALPTTVYPGEYQLELTVTDQLGDKIGDAATDFEIVAE